MIIIYLKNKFALILTPLVRISDAMRAIHDQYFIAAR